MRRFLSAAIATLCCYAIQGQTYAGSAATALGGNGLLLKDGFSVFSNVAALPSQKSMEAALQVRSLFNSDITGSRLGIAAHSGGIGWGAGLDYTGNRLFSTSQICFGLSNRLAENSSIGLGLRYTLMQSSGYKNRGRLGADFGLIHGFSKRLQAAMSIRNIRITESEQHDLTDNLPATASLGIRYEAASTATVFFSINQGGGFPANGAAGIEYRPNKALSLRGSMSTGYSPFAFGIGYLYKKITLDAACRFHRYLGVSPEMSIRYPLF